MEEQARHRDGADEPTERDEAGDVVARELPHQHSDGRQRSGRGTGCEHALGQMRGPCACKTFTSV